MAPERVRTTRTKSRAAAAAGFVICNPKKEINTTKECPLMMVRF